MLCTRVSNHRRLSPRNWFQLAVLAAALAAPAAHAQISYDFSTGVGTTRFAYKDRIPESTIPPLTSNIPSTIFSSSNYSRLVNTDDVRYATGNIGGSYRAATRFVFKIAELPASIASMTVRWEGRAQNGGTIRLYLWNAATSSYELMGTTTSTSDVNLSKTYTGSAASYISGSQMLTLLAVNNCEERGVTTDYVKVTISQCLTSADCDDHNACTNDACNAGICKYTSNTNSCSDDNPCTMGDVCSDGACHGGPPPNCESAGGDCTIASCDPSGAPGNCNHHAPRIDGTACNDSLYCTIDDACVSGVCHGSLRDCAASSDQCHSGVCNEATDSCEAQSVPDGTACHDDKFCTVNDACTNGVCGGSSRSCAALSNQCNEGVCNEDSDACEARPVANETSCDDGKYCTIADRCDAGQCVGVSRDCSSSSDQCNIGTCNEEAEHCEGKPRENGTTCDDGQFCTVSDVCTGGTCSGSAKDCSALTDSCNTGVCNEETDECKAVPVANGTGCDDGAFCTVNDACVQGACRGTSRDCSSAGDQCNSGTCDEEQNVCKKQPRPDGIECDDELFCTVDDKCSNGVCGGSSRDCGDTGNPCTTSFCLEASDKCTSIPVPDGTGCDDGHFCTLKDTCTAGACGGIARDCSYLNDQCNSGVCNDETKKCEPRPIEDGSACDDELFCTVHDACTAGACIGSARDCSAAGDQCNVGRCNEKTDACVAQPLADGTDCDDHNACNVGETCQHGSCSGGATQSCPDIVDCHLISCNPSGPEGNCAGNVALVDGTPCDDGAFCTTLDACHDGTCKGGPAPCLDDLICDEPDQSCVECLTAADCDDGVGCTDDACKLGTCFHSANDHHCPDNGLHCDGLEYCDEKLDCQSSGNPCPADQMCDESTNTCGDCLADSDCNDGVECTSNRCIHGGCVYTPVNANCEDDGQFCTGTEICDAQRGCISTGTPCGELEFCNEKSDRCDECRVDADCDDGDPCTIGHACVKGVCRAPLAVDCSAAGNQCNAASCDPHGETGNCAVLTPLVNGTECNDGAWCTVGDQCTEGACGGVPRNCTQAGNQCNVGVCNEEAGECQPKPVEDGASCDDGLYCTVGDTCTNGTCEGTARDCSGVSDQCNTGICNEESGSCDAIPVENGISCDDELYCTVEDACNEGACRGKSRDCSLLSDQCNVGICNEASQECVALPVADGVSCNDANACNVGETCQAGACKGGTPQDCSVQSDQCNTVTCDPSGDEGNCAKRTQAEDGTRCDDAVYCTVEDACTAGVCKGSPRSCESQGNQCNTGVCNEETHQCEARPVEDGSLCDDGSYCTVNDVCVQGACGGDAKDCSTLDDQCHIGTCNEDSDACEARPREDGTECDDGLYCTVKDTCTSGTCAGVARECGDVEDQCNHGVCNEELDSCEPRPVEDGTACDDGRFCTVSETCQSGACTGGDPRDCSDVSNQCNTGVCNEDTNACEGLPLKDGTLCDDGLYCTVDDACREGTCTGPARDCGASPDRCIASVCDEAADSCELQPVEDGKPCDDQYGCTSNDSCQGGVCVSYRTYELDVWHALAECLTGPDYSVESDCECSDLDGDGLGDLIDVAEFMRGVGRR